MTVLVDIGDRLYDYTDEEKASEVIAEFQADHALSDDAILAIWSDTSDARRAVLERLIYAAVDGNGTAKRAAESVPWDLTLYIEEVSSV